MSDVKNEAYYLEHQEEFAALTEEQQTSLILSGFVEGDTAAEDPEATDKKPEAEEARKAESDDTPAVEPEEKAAEPVVLAKDGKHTIPFAELEDARERARYWEQKAKDAEKRPGPDKPATDEPQPLDVKSLRKMAMEFMVEGDYDKAAELQAQADAEVLRVAEDRTTQRVAHLERHAQETANEAHFRAIKAAHPDFDTIVQGDALAKWVAAQPSIVKGVYASILEQGSTEQVIELFSVYKGQNPTHATPTALPKVDVAQAVAKVKPATPMSLSDIPAGSRSPHDEADAIRSMEGIRLIEKFSAMSPSQIEAMMSRLL